MNLSLQIRDLVGNDCDELPAVATGIVEEVDLLRIVREIVEIDRGVFPFGHCLSDQESKSAGTKLEGNEPSAQEGRFDCQIE